jgi:transposase
MPQNFLTCARDQPLLLPPDLRDWLPQDHLAWFVIEAVDELDLEPFYAAYRDDGHGRAAHEPKMMVGLLAYAYCVGERSSRGIERRCREDVAFRVICANQAPDHATIARFRVRHQEALAELFSGVLGLCAKAGLVEVAVLAIDGTKLEASASNHATRSYEQIAEEILAEAGRIDAAEDELHGEARGDELPERLRTPEGRREFFRRARQQPRREQTDPEPSEKPEAEASEELELELDTEQIVSRVQGREGWLREGKRQLEERRWQDPDPVRRSRRERLLVAAQRLEADLEVERRANEAYEAYRAGGRMKDGRRFGGPPKPYEPPDKPEGKINLTDPDSKNMKAYRGYVQGYNAQTVTTQGQIIVAAEIAPDGLDFAQLDPMVSAAERELAEAGVAERPGVVLADAGYWANDHIDRLRERGITPLVAPDADKRKGPRKTRLGGPYNFMRRVLQSDTGAEFYSRRQWMIEPVFAEIKQNRRAGRFKRRGRGAVRSEWRLIAATHNLLKLHRHTLAAAAA